MHPIFDTQFFPTQKPFNRAMAAEERPGIDQALPAISAQETLPQRLAQLLPGGVGSTEAHLPALAQGGVGIAVAAFSQPERPWFRPLQRQQFLEDPEGGFALVSALTQSREPKLKLLFERLKKNQGVDYYGILQEEFNWLLAENQRLKGSALEFRLLEDFAHLQETRMDEKPTLGVLLAVRGGHNLMHYQSDADQEIPPDVVNNTDSPEYTFFEEALEENIQALKKWGKAGSLAPFYITLAGHFWNGLCGHAHSLPERLLQAGITEEFGVDTGITALGYQAIAQLLGKQNGRRILIDVHGMSVRSRVAYYKHLRNTYWSRSDNVPILYLGGGSAGTKTMLEATRRRDSTLSRQESYYNNGTINLSDEEIRLIVESDGFIGLSLDPSSLGGGIAHRELQAARTEKGARKTLMQLFTANLFRVVRAVGKVKAYDHVGLCSEMGYLYRETAGYSSAADLQAFAEDFIAYLKSPETNPYAGIDKGDVEMYLFQQPAEEIAQKVLSGSFKAFLSRYFQPEYLS